MGATAHCQTLAGTARHMPATHPVTWVTPRNLTKHSVTDTAENLDLGVLIKLVPAWVGR